MSLQIKNYLSFESPQTINLESWKIEINTANNAFIHGQHSQAFNHYEAALGLAKFGVSELLNTEHVAHLLFEAERQIAAFVVTHHNLADLFRQSGCLEKSIAHLCDAHETVFQLSHHKKVSMRELAQRHLKVTYQELIIFTQLHGNHFRIQQCLIMTQYICECCREKHGH
jgi:hypothetical protein